MHYDLTILCDLRHQAPRAALADWWRLASDLPHRDRAFALHPGFRDRFCPHPSDLPLDTINPLNYFYKLLQLLPYDQEDDDLFGIFWHSPGRVQEGRTSRVATWGHEVPLEAVLGKGKDVVPVV